MNFSQRMGLEPVTKPIQKDSMNAALRNGLWNAFDLTIFDDLRRAAWNSSSTRVGVNEYFYVKLWDQFFRLSLSQLPSRDMDAAKYIHSWFFDASTSWNHTYEFIEFVGKFRNELTNSAQSFRNCCNTVLERENSAYRFVGGIITPITNEAEIFAIEQAAAFDSCPLAPVSTHIKAAMQLLSDRTQPDYRNSMKESISAVEALCKIIANDKKATLGDALKVISKQFSLNPALKSAFSAIYGYTSDDHGIRHALKDDAEPEAEDSLFFLVMCSAFVNFLVEKARKNGLLPT